jgi:hypothetical protein
MSNMKKILFLILLLPIIFACKAQSKTFNLTPSYKQIYHQGDTIIGTAQLITSDGLGTISWNVIYGPGIPTLSSPSNIIFGNTVTSSVTVLNAIPGIYVLNATGKSPSGTTGNLTDSLVVLPPTPPCPPQRSLVGYVITGNLVNGVWVTVTALKYSDGSTQ